MKDDPRPGDYLVEIRPLGPESDAYLARESFDSPADARRRAAQALRGWAAEDLALIGARMDARDPAHSAALAALCRAVAERLEVAELIGAADGPLEATTRAGESVAIRRRSAVGRESAT